jgi:glycosyltransferase involved in cell wall biosynthesis
MGGPPVKVAIVHDYLNQAGGAERVVAAMHRLFPQAPIYTTIADPRVVDALMPGADVRTTWMQRLPGIDRHFRKYFLLYPHAIEGLDLSGYDVVLSSSSAYAKGARVRRDAVHVCYCHTPMRFAWNFEGYAERERWGSMTRRILPPLIARVRRWDLRTADRPTIYVANSSIVARRIEEHYHRRATVIPPPVEVHRFTPSPIGDGPFLIVSRLVAYKRIDLAVEAFTRLNRPLVVIGDGPARMDLERIAGPTVQFLGRVNDAEVSAAYARCRAVIFPGEEDFGIVPLEANAAGRPVIAYEGGGALDTVIPGHTGLFFPEPAAESLMAAVLRSEEMPWDPARLRAHAEGFREEVFADRMSTLVQALHSGATLPPASAA